MKKLTMLVVVLFSVSQIFGRDIDTLDLESKIKDVTVFFDGAQITRIASKRLEKGKHLLVVDRLPAELNPQSIQVKNDESFKILSVKHELTYPKSKSKIKEEYDEKIEQKEMRMKEISNELDVYRIEEKILLSNSDFSSKDSGTTIDEIKEASVFYRQKLNEIRKEKLKLSLEKKKLKDNIHELYKELNKKLAKENKTYSKISIIVSVKNPVKTTYKVSYFVASAGWSPIYDFRVNSIKEPLNIVYNAKIFQSTGEDWEKVNLTLSTNRPSVNNEKPTLEPWFIDRARVEHEKMNINGQSALKGVVTESSTSEPLPFANIVVTDGDKTIAGGVTDFDGYCLIKPIPPGVYNVEVSYVGYEKKKVQSVRFSSDNVVVLDFRLEEGELLSEVEVVQYKIPLIDKDGGASGGVITREEISRMPSRSARAVASNVRGVRGNRDNSYYYIDGIKVRGNTSLPANKVVLIDGYATETNITSLEYKIDIPYSISSDGEDYTVKIKEIQTPAEYVYFAVPKLDEEAFLTALIENWTALDLLPGKISTYYKGTFTGESEIKAVMKDTLSISLNRDKNVALERRLLKEKNEKLFLGKNVKEFINWSISVKNNTDEVIKIKLEDQFPVAENRLIDIARLETSGGRVEEKTGIVTWELELKPGEKKELLLKYSIKYPAYMMNNLSLE